MTETVQNVLRDLRSGLEGLYRERLRGLYLYGFYARGEQEWDSDVDLLIISNQIGAYGAEIEHE
jgi:predicted nucleotidyltransferase